MYRYMRRSLRSLSSMMTLSYPVRILLGKTESSYRKTVSSSMDRVIHRWLCDWPVSLMQRKEFQGNVLALSFQTTRLAAHLEFEMTSLSATRQLFQIKSALNQRVRISQCSASSVNQSASIAPMELQGTVF